MAAVLAHVLAVLGACCLLPVLIFLHELGHAIPPVAAGGRAHVMVGSTEGRTAEFGPIRVTVGADRLWSPLYFGYCRWDGVSSRLVQGAALLGGPAASVFAVCAAFVALAAVENDVVRFGVTAVFYNQAWVVLVTLLPIRYPSWFGRYAGDTSDGYKLLETLRG